MEATSTTEQKRCRAILDNMIDKEIENTNELLGLLGSGVEFMATTDLTETPLIHGRNLEDLLTKRIALMIRHRDDEPFIDPAYTERKAAQAYELT
jgi:hypothetical protein